MSVRVVRSIAHLRAELDPVRRAGQSIGLVPTMGALHAAHVRLMEIARAASRCVVASIFVNPIQFNLTEDYAHYPRTGDTDLDICSRAGVDLVFAPSVEEMYPEPLVTHVEVAKLSEHLCGPFRPGHFRGVATVVAKLFNIVQPTSAYFGEKDAQQLAIIRRMVKDLNIPVEIIGVPTVREPDGLALSSRNQRLTPAERSVAPALYRALQAAAESIAAGQKEPNEVHAIARAQLDPYPQIKLEYLEFVDPETLQPLEFLIPPVRIAIAAWLGAVRLIDNVRV